MANNVSIPVPSSAPVVVASAEVTTLNGVTVPAQQVQLFSIVHTDDAGTASRSRQWLTPNPAMLGEIFVPAESIQAFVTRAFGLGCKTIRVYYQQQTPSFSGTLELQLSYPNFITFGLALATFGLGGEEVGPWAFVDHELDPNITDLLPVGATVIFKLAAF